MAIISTSKSSLITMLPIFVFLIYTFPFMALSAPILETFHVPSGGPESYVFDSMGSLYTGVNDGRIVKHEGPVLGFVDFAYASPHRTSDCDGTTDPEMGSICGRTLGLGFYYKTNQLYIADAYHGLCVVGPQGGLATQLLSKVNGLPLKWLDGLDVDQTTGKVYFTDVSTQYNLSQVADHISTGDSTGRLIEYDPETKTARVLLSGLKGAGGVGASKDGSFVLLSEFTGSRITKYWLTGPKADTAELLLDISGPANMKLTSAGEFWVALNVATPAGNVPTGMRMDENGKLLETLNFGGEPYNENYITEVHEYKGSIYIASIYVEFGAVYKKVSEEEKTLLGSVNLSEEFSSF